MKSVSAAFQAAAAAGSLVAHAAVIIATGTPFKVWSGEGDLPLGADTFVGVGDAGLVTASGGQIGASQDGLELSLSGVDPETANLVDYADARNASVTTWKLAYDPSGQTILDAQVYDRGRLDKLVRDDTPAGTATLRAIVETAARGLGRKTGRNTSDADQRLIAGTDGSSARIAQAGDLTLAWGGKPPARAGLALPGAYVPGTYGGGLVGRVVDGVFSQLD